MNSALECRIWATLASLSFLSPSTDFHGVPRGLAGHLTFQGIFPAAPSSLAMPWVSPPHPPNWVSCDDAARLLAGEKVLLLTGQKSNFKDTLENVQLHSRIRVPVCKTAATQKPPSTKTVFSSCTSNSPSLGLQKALPDGRLWVSLACMPSWPKPAGLAVFISGQLLHLGREPVEFPRILSSPWCSQCHIRLRRTSFPWETATVSFQGQGGEASSPWA